MLRDILLIMLSGAMLVLAFPPGDLWFLAWVGLVPFFFALDGRTKRMAFLLGLLLGFVFFMGTVYWVVNSMVAYGGSPGIHKGCNPHSRIPVGPFRLFPVFIPTSYSDSRYYRRIRRIFSDSCCQYVHISFLVLLVREKQQAAIQRGHYTLCCYHRCFIIRFLQDL